MSSIYPTTCHGQAKRSWLSLLKEYGVLSVPTVLMALFGSFGCRTGQTKYKMLSFLLNLICVLNSTVVTILNVITILNFLDKKNVNSLFMITFESINTVTTVCLLAILYKKYNLIMLLKKVKNIRQCHLTKWEVLHILVILLSILSVTIYIYALNIRFIVKLYRRGLIAFYQPYKWKISNPILIQILLFSETMLHLNVSWLLTSSTGFMICVISLVLSKEFQKCVLDLEKSFTEQRCLTEDTFNQSKDRFYKLVSVVQKVDEMFSFFIGFVLIQSLALLCFAIYSSLQGQDIEAWTAQVILSSLAVATLLPPLAKLSSKVNTEVEVKTISTQNESKQSLCLPYPDSLLQGYTPHLRECPADFAEC